MRYAEKVKLAKNPNTPGDVLRIVAKDVEWIVRAWVAENPSAPVDALRELAKDGKWDVRLYVAKNTNTPEDILREMAKDECSEVRYYLAKNPKASSNLLVILFEYEKSFRKSDNSVIKALYAHKNLPAFAKRVIETLLGEML